MKKYILIAAVLITALLTGCSPSQPSNQWSGQQQDVQVYKVEGTNGTTVVVNNNGGGGNQGVSTSDMFLYWYLFSNSGHYYYYSSPTYIAPSSYSSVAWQTSTTEPAAVRDVQDGKAQGQEIENNEVSDNTLGAQVESEMAENGYAPAQEAEAAPSTETLPAAPAASEEGSSSSSESSSSEGSSSGDSGGGDSGGGDSGGGDGGGGD